MTVLWRYLLANPLAGLREFPRRPPRRVWVAVFLYSCWATAVGFGSGLLELELVGSRLWWILPVSLLVFPSFLEEFVFRGILIARTITDRGAVRTWLVIGLSTVLFVFWHPLNGALLLHRTASDISYAPLFFVNCGGAGCRLRILLCGDQVSVGGYSHSLGHGYGVGVFSRRQESASGALESSYGIRSHRLSLDGYE
jgi:predicted Abi (CAAX) family protease